MTLQVEARASDSPFIEQVMHGHTFGPGQTVRPAEVHWHGAAPNRFMTHLALVEVDDQGNVATWGEHVTDEEYGAEPAP